MKKLKLLALITVLAVLCLPVFTGCCDKNVTDASVFESYKCELFSGDTINEVYIKDTYVPKENRVAYLCNENLKYFTLTLSNGNSSEGYLYEVKGNYLLLLQPSFFNNLNYRIKNSNNTFDYLPQSVVIDVSSTTLTEYTKNIEKSIVYVNIYYIVSWNVR